ncbi:MAG: DUF1761 domain-containing protein [Bacteroidia bacterium]|nr:DUF1761 domain-containing protein [Bacteroidia bacterium]
MGQLTINHLAVWAGIVFLTILGFVWYGPLFGDQWMAMVGLDMATVEANPPGAGVWISNMIATIIPMYVLAWLFVKLEIESALYGAGIGLLIAFSFVFLSDMTGDMFAGNPYGLSWITGGFSMVGLAVGGAILGGWRKYKARA